MNAPLEAAVIKQHLIDPEICIRCNTCESICPVGAITHDSRNYVVDVSKCNWCNDCISPCPTVSIDNYRSVPAAKAYSLDEQLGWDTLPAELSREQLAELVGTSRETTTKVLNELREHGLIGLRRGMIALRDRVALLAFAEGETADQETEV